MGLLPTNQRDQGMVAVGLVSLALAWGAAHHFLAVPRLGRDGVIGLLSRSLVGESVVAMAVLLAAAVLVDSKPPPQPVKNAPTATSQR
jgi:putative copper export protein